MQYSLVPKRREVEWKINDQGFVIITISKSLGRVESKLADLLGAPRDVRRSLDDMNSHLWMLMDGTNSMESIVEEMDKKFAERITPVSERVTKSIEQFAQLGLVEISKIESWGH